MLIVVFCHCLVMAMKMIISSQTWEYQGIVFLFIPLSSISEINFFAFFLLLSLSCFYGWDWPRFDLERTTSWIAHCLLIQCKIWHSTACLLFLLAHTVLHYSWVLPMKIKHFPEYRFHKEFPSRSRLRKCWKNLKFGWRHSVMLSYSSRNKTLAKVVKKYVKTDISIL